MKKLKNNEGSAIVVSIILMMITTIVVATITLQVKNQLNYNKKQEESLKVKYIAEAGIENTLALAIEQVENKINNFNNKQSEKLYSDDDGKLRLEIDKYKNSLSLDEMYIVEKISEEIPITIKKTVINEKEKIYIQKVEDIKFDILSKGYLSKDEYKIKATIVLKTLKKENDFITKYNVVAYDKIDK